MIHDGSQEQSSVRQSSMGLGDGNSQEPQPEWGVERGAITEIPGDRPVVRAPELCTNRGQVRKGLDLTGKRGDHNQKGNMEHTV